MSAPAAPRHLTRTDRREAELHQVNSGNREHWEGGWCDRVGNPVVKHASAAMREIHEAGLVELAPGPVPNHFYARLTAEGTVLLYDWTRPRGRWARR